MLADLFAAPLLWANEMVVESGDGVSDEVVVLLDGVAWAARDVRRRIEGKKKGAELPRTGVEAFVERLTSHQTLVDKSQKLAQLRVL